MADREFVLETETDSRFPSGKWTGYHLMPQTGARRHPQELVLLFRKGRMTGEGRDAVGKFVIEGKYATDDGKARWLKTYIGAHTVVYNGYNEGKGIWGVWEIAPYTRGGFHIWPDGIGMSDLNSLRAEEPVPEESKDAALMPV